MSIDLRVIITCCLLVSDSDSSSSKCSDTEFDSDSAWESDCSGPSLVEHSSSELMIDVSCGINQEQSESRAVEPHEKGLIVFQEPPLLGSSNANMCSASIPSELTCNTHGSRFLAQAVLRSRDRIATALAQELIDDSRNATNAQISSPSGPSCVQMSSKRGNTIKYFQNRINKNGPVSGSRKLYEVQCDNSEIVASKEEKSKAAYCSQRRRSVSDTKDQSGDEGVRLMKLSSKKSITLQVPTNTSKHLTRTPQKEVAQDSKGALKLWPPPEESCETLEDKQSKPNFLVNLPIQTVYSQAFTSGAVNRQFELPDSPDDSDSGSPCVSFITDCAVHSQKQRSPFRKLSCPVVHTEEFDRRFDQPDSPDDSDSSSPCLPSIPCSPILPATTSLKRPLSGSRTHCARTKRRKTSRRNVSCSNSDSKPGQVASTQRSTFSTGFLSPCNRSDGPCGKPFCFDCAISS